MEYGVLALRNKEHSDYSLLGINNVQFVSISMELDLVFFNKKGFEVIRCVQISNLLCCSL